MSEAVSDQPGDNMGSIERSILRVVCCRRRFLAVQTDSHSLRGASNTSASSLTLKNGHGATIDASSGHDFYFSRQCYQ